MKPVEFPTLLDEAKRNVDRVTPLGRELGRQNVELLVDPGLAQLAAAGELDERCGSCAGRLGTIPNGCLQTQADFLKACMEDVPFACHAHESSSGKLDRLCHAWFAARITTGAAVRPMPWPFIGEPANG